MRQSPLVGYNNNVRHRGHLFHIQTEDSGLSHPHVITHLFMDGGRILKSVKTSYAEHVGTEKVSDFVRTLMKEQHKGMLLRLRAGEFEAAIDPQATQSSALQAKATTAAAERAVRFSELPSLSPPPSTSTRGRESGRYAATEPALALGMASPMSAIPKAASPRSLDELILSYLAEDLD
jgi:hypothetical protein